MASKVSRDVKIVGVAFLLIFFGFGSIHSYTTVFFSEAGLVDLGFQSLILIYVFFALSNPLSAVLVSRYGAKRCMMVSSLFYSLYVLLILTKEVYIVYLASMLLGVFASTLWTGQISYLIRASDRSLYGTNSGFFSTVKTLGTGLGVFALGSMIPFLMFDLSFIVFSVFPLAGLLMLVRISDLRAGHGTRRFRISMKAITSPTVLRVSSVWFSFSFVSGLIIGIIPIQIKETLGVPYVGILSSMFYVFPVLFYYYSGRISDRRGRLPMISVAYVLILLGLVMLPSSANAYLLFLGAFMIALSRIITYPSISALNGDLATGSNLEPVAAAFLTVENLGVVSSLIVSRVFMSGIATVYTVSIIVALVSMGVFLPLLRRGTEKLREQIAREVG